MLFTGDVSVFANHNDLEVLDLSDTKVSGKSRSWSFLLLPVASGNVLDFFCGRKHPGVCKNPKPKELGRCINRR